MRLYRAKDYNDLSRKAANIISAQVIMKPDCVLGLATGSSPLGTYRQLIEWYKKGDLDFSEVKSVNLDEYKGLPKDNDQSYYYFMHQNFFKDININPENTHIPNGMEPDSEKECSRYNQVISDLGGIDLQLLGLGHNGHIGFNEPGSPLDAKTRKVALTESTIKANARYFEREEDVPRYAYSMGIGSIMQSKEILLEAFGAKKAQAVKALVEGPVDANVPATILQKHPNVTVIVDKQAAALLTKE